MRKGSFVLYTSYLQQINLLNLEQRGALFTALLAYASGEDLPEMDGMTQMCFAFIKQDMDENREKYEAVCQKRAEAGKKGGRPKTNGLEEEAKKTNAFPKKQEEPNETKQKRFTPPTVQEVRDYINDKGYTVDAQRFVDFYDSKGWMIGKNKMKDWKAAVRTWNKSGETPQKPTRFNNFHERDYDYSDLERQLLGG